MDEIVEVTRGLRIPPGELEWRFSRSSGPGGQNVNTRDTRAEVVFDVSSSPSLGPRQRERLLRKLAGKLDADGRLHVTASDERSQAANRRLALERLCEALREGLRPDPPKRKRTRPSKAARQRRLDEKRARSRVKRERSWRPDG